MRKNLILTPLIMLIAAGTVSAQDLTTASLTGRVTSQDGSPLQGVRVTVESPSLLQPRHATTDASGHFRLMLLPNGEYTITYSLTQYRSARRTLRLLAGQTFNADVRMSPMDVQELSIEIVGTRAQVDKTDSIVQSNFSADSLESIVGRNYTALNALVPGVNSSLSNQGRLSVRGGTGHSTKLLLDGTTVTELLGGYTISTFAMQDLIESVALIQSPLNARYGNTDGGMVTIVTAKGSNKYAGNMRFTGRRPQWEILDPGYQDRRGNLGGAWAPDDELEKEYEVTLSGPIWKDHITFTYGAKLTPTWYGSGLISDWSSAGRRWTTPTPQASDRVGIYYRDANTGDVIRKAEMRDYNTPDGRLYQHYSQTYNQFSLFGQINPNHQIEWNYTEASENGGNYGYQYPAENMPRSREGFDARYWNVAYKGIIGSSGVLEVRHGVTWQSWWYGDSSIPNDPIRLRTIPSYVPRDGNYSNHNDANYMANGYLHTSMPSNTGSGQANFLVDAVNVDNFDGGGITGTVLNYQHILQAKGMHIIDVGFQRDGFLWNTKSGGAPFLFDNPGQIAENLSYSDIYNPNGSPVGNPSNYAGRYIVFNVPAARYSDIDPYAVAAGLVDRPLIVDGAVDSTYSWAYPRVLERFGNPNGQFETEMTSYYINDMWSISENHSVMAGLRFDNFKGWDTQRKFVSYSLPTFRFEYKWDIHGDQSRLVNVSLGQFHTMTPAGLFTPQALARYNSNRTRYWSVGSAQPYLVTWEEVKNINNYGYVHEENLGGPNYRTDPDWKAPVSTEFSVGFRRNLNNGGSWRATFTYRTWENDYDYYPGEFFDQANGALQVRRVLKNTNEYDRTYTGVELEWDLPITKRANFGGSYTFNRLMNNWPDRSDAGNAGSAPALNLDSYWDTYWSRDTWAPMRLMDPEHFFKFYILFDLTSGKVKSSVALRGSYTSGTPYQDTITYRVGFPSYPGVIAGPAGGTAPGGAGTGGFSDSRAVPINTMSTYQDIWSTALRYNLSLPLVSKLSWFMTIDINNPFNHRGIRDWFRPGGLSNSVIPNDIGSVPASDPYNGVWRTDNNVLGLYRERMSGRTFSLTTGLRF
ncbi:MAG: carboxypeptidase regulatory-like domain-containing protein [Holophagaceae bacterium]|nr:carboxypeptidase regulatory-like domain-containing protein [Holophagaceae bacterium]